MTTTKSHVLPLFCIYEDWLYQGSQTSLKHKQFVFVQESGITHIINLTEELKYQLPESFTKGENAVQLIHYPMSDNENQNMMEVLGKLIELIKQEKEKNPTSKFYIHCLAGVSRSVAITIGVVMAFAKMNFETALEHVKQKRMMNSTSPNSGFVNQLRKFQTSLGIPSTTSLPAPSEDDDIVSV